MNDGPGIRAEPPSVGAVVIGRNEGQRLVRCLASLSDLGGPVVYVDSGSTDGSVAAAEAAGAEVVRLDLSRPFTAARARNAGAYRLKALAPVDLIQFVDGDCEMAPGWTGTAAAFLAGRPDVAVVCGRLRERDPEASVYNWLCEREWDQPPGETRACGGIALYRADAFHGAGGFLASLIAGEEPELCVRLRQAGWKVWRLDDDMASHDAAMTRFRQWWTRMRRGGHAYAEGAALHGAPPERHWVAETRRALLWGMALPLLTLIAVLIVGPWALLLLLAYPVQILRLSRRMPLRQAAFLTLGKLAEAQGVASYMFGRIARRRSRLIEYK